MNANNIFSELKRRNVYKVAVAYAVIGWLLIQIATQVFPFFEIPNWGVRLIVLAIVIGFPIALLLTWAFELTPEGVRRTRDEDLQAGRIDSTARSPKNRTWIYVSVIGAAFSISLFFVGRYTARNSSRTPGVSANELAAKSIAVLPFLNESDDARDEYFSDGLSEELIAALAQINELKVIGRSSSFRFKERKEESKLIGEKLGVATLLEGTVRKQGDSVRIVAELINAADGIDLWTRTFDRELKDIFAVQQEIAAAVAASLKIALLGADERLAANPVSTNTGAHNAYLLGHYYFQRRNLEGYQKAIEYFDEATRLDPGYALAYTERAEVRCLIGDRTGQKTEWAKAQNDAEKAVAIAPALAEARAALGWVRIYIEWRFAEGLEEIKRAKEFSPGNLTANDLLARVVVYSGKLDEAEKLARHGLELDPLSAVTGNFLARVLYFAGKLDEADATARKTAELQPSAAASHRWQVQVAAQRGDGEMALREAKLEPDESYQWFELALAHHVRRDRAAADVALADLIAKGRNHMAYQIAEICAVRGEKDKALEWLQTSFDARDAGTYYLGVDPLLRNLRSDPRFQSLLARLNFPSYP